MPKTFSSKYFMNSLRKLRLIVSRLEGYKTIDELLAVQQNMLELNVVNQNQGREQ